MTISIKKPILVAGVSLSFLLWIGESLKNSVNEAGDFSLLGLTLIGSLWLFWQRKKNNKVINNYPLVVVNREDFDKKIAQIKYLLEDLITESPGHDLLNKFNEKILIIDQKSQKKDLNLTIVSQNKITPQTLVNSLKQEFAENIVYSIESDIFNYTNYQSSDDDNFNFKNLSLESDFILFILHGDITESEKKVIEKININQRILVLFNDIDYPLLEEKNLIFENIKTKLKGIINAEFIIKIATNTQKVKVKKYIDKINYKEWEEVSQGQYNSLFNTLRITFEKEKENLIIATSYRNSIDLEKEIRKELNIIRKQKALPLIEKYQIIAATATFANPVSSLDLLATAAINTQMLIDLSAIYKQSLSVNQGKEISIELAKLMVKLGIVEVSSRMITTILKSNAVTFIAGGIIQGISAAYLTRLCGLSLIEYYEVAELKDNEGINLSVIKEKLQLIFQQNRDNNFFNKFIQKTSLQFQNS
ncbi:YcjF family protein [Geminocystis sp. NIES-3709]|uniref:YcjF family protein n=1 Tax=Geminocystis sp. NIES-3709 TaxID=1617448 RepID=UPI0005FC660A|nr:YcjF family protein [Geminocystis sp. NIES-3709]BAQ63459.1 hypothetical protein GM3709_224 [Geminocystis sp. NIES-3709]